MVESVTVGRNNPSGRRIRPAARRKGTSQLRGCCSRSDPPLPSVMVVNSVRLVPDVPDALHLDMTATVAVVVARHVDRLVAIIPRASRLEDASCAARQQNKNAEQLFHRT